ncbi:MAG: 23S rRNA (uracil(1939)-C(5))-methyltransferase RlmD [Gammaproteobacteria bacterium]|nr:23S rRNA (uracil(1939)-C(5))-methyltransferase RlmD [Gammaproteobacteria bacterium]MDH5652615.1 23S rRNA (uracil(1939)-C(5))-methyltransferase RlmD [Gammaproteobacteria bacterium]
MSRRKQKLPTEPVIATIESLTHEGRGVTHIDGKAVFVDGVLPKEEVRCRYVHRHRRYDEAELLEILRASPERVTPRCAHFAVCGGCSLQHLAAEQQIGNKQQVLLDNLQRIGKVTPATVLPPMTGPVWGYRRKARLGVKYVIKKGKVLVGFREKRSGFLAELERCEVLHPDVGMRLTELAELIATLACRDRLPQIEVAVGDNATALVLRHLDPLSAEDHSKLIDYAKTTGLWLYLQPAGPDSIVPLWPEQPRLFYRLDEYDVEIDFEPGDFVQVNSDINRQMIHQALALLDVQPDDRVLELFCGLGNFSFALARQAATVTSVEGEKSLIDRARLNAQQNGLDNVSFHVADLAATDPNVPWLKQGDYSKVLLDPARTGADGIIPQLGKLAVPRIVYVSCNPATLARDAGMLCHDYGYQLVSAGVMDMFPHTAHVESIALFERKK